MPPRPRGIGNVRRGEVPSSPGFSEAEWPGSAGAERATCAWNHRLATAAVAPSSCGVRSPPPTRRSPYRTLPIAVPCGALLGRRRARGGSVASGMICDWESTIGRIASPGSHSLNRRSGRSPHASQYSGGCAPTSSCGVRSPPPTRHTPYRTLQIADPCGASRWAWHGRLAR
jgi:hypothetical protein